MRTPIARHDYQVVVEQEEVVVVEEEQGEEEEEEEEALVMAVSTVEMAVQTIISPLALANF